MTKLAEAMKAVDQAETTVVPLSATHTSSRVREQILMERDHLKARAEAWTKHIDAEMAHLRAQGQQIADMLRSVEALESALNNLRD